VSTKHTEVTNDKQLKTKNKNMATTEHFYVSSRDNSVKKTTEPTREYFISNGKKVGEAKYIIEVFGDNHYKTAKKVRDMVDNAEMDKNLFNIRVQTR
jgi:hypothetical protein